MKIAYLESGRPLSSMPENSPFWKLGFLGITINLSWPWFCRKKSWSLPILMVDDAGLFIACRQDFFGSYQRGLKNCAGYSLHQASVTARIQRAWLFYNSNVRRKSYFNDMLFTSRHWQPAICYEVWPKGLSRVVQKLTHDKNSLQAMGRNLTIFMISKIHWVHRESQIVCHCEKNFNWLQEFVAFWAAGRQ